MTEEKVTTEEILEEEAEREEEPQEEKTEEPEELKEDKPEENREEDEALEAKYMRLMADFQNYKRRTEAEKSNVYAYANEQIVLRLLEVIDNFERALDHKDTAEKAFAEGMEMIFRQLLDVLKNSNVEEIEALGREFDPNFHNAVLMEDTDEYESNTVSAVLQKGYTLNGKVIRPSMVKVAN
ncbi:MAG: nucleotide exchange factor GrpE [Clostridiales bacterium]|nr:nucleotide exchange factor GrpE [Clostridiales bacterium]MDD6389229.1 nucleotide exchange factor GrpE [Bacillota bacterium]MDY5976533.1 nucleotide exchange factor GrpE [Anaerovoracaceae bacterium]